METHGDVLLAAAQGAGKTHGLERLEQQRTHVHLVGLGVHRHGAAQPGSPGVFQNRALHGVGLARPQCAALHHQGKRRGNLGGTQRCTHLGHHCAVGGRHITQLHHRGAACGRLAAGWQAEFAPDVERLGGARAGHQRHGWGIGHCRCVGLRRRGHGDSRHHRHRV